jgi:hypothetical protein
MNHRNLINDAWVYSSNARAEDGLQPPSGWRALCDTVLVPIGLYIALFLILLLNKSDRPRPDGERKNCRIGEGCKWCCDPWQ